MSGGRSAISAAPGDAAGFHLIEATVESIHAAYLARRLSCRGLVQLYLDRIAAYDRQGPAITAVQSLNPKALAEAEAIDRRIAEGGIFAPLAGIPVLVKDQLDTDFMPTSYGSALFRDFVPARNATVIERLRQAGAVILAKTTMGEFAQGYSGSAFGDCRNPYDPERSPSGSSCGSGAGIAANFAVLGIGEDTGGSVRGPAAHGSLVGLRPTLPLVSRFGMMPFAPTRDTIGPIARTVRDTALLLDAIAGYDSRDPVTAESYGRVPESYTRFLIPDGLPGLRFGVFRHPFEKADIEAPDYQEVQAAIDGALAVLGRRGAEILDPLLVPDFHALFEKGGRGEYEPEAAIDAFLATEKDPPFRTLREIVAQPEVHPKRREELERVLGRSTAELGYLKERQARDALRVALLAVMAEARLDALLYATYDHAPAPVPVSTPGSNRRLASLLGFPAISLPGGFFADGLPIGIELMARPFAEPILFRAAFDFELTTRHRRPPASVPALPGEP